MGSVNYKLYNQIETFSNAISLTIFTAVLSKQGRVPDESVKEEWA